MIHGLFLITILAIVLERALALIYENKYVDPLLKNRGVKDIIAAIIAFWICNQWQIDIIATSLERGLYTVEGGLITALCIAGGSKASIKLFQDVLNLKNEKLSNTQSS